MRSYSGSARSLRVQGLSPQGLPRFGLRRERQHELGRERGAAVAVRFEVEQGEPGAPQQPVDVREGVCDIMRRAVKLSFDAHAERTAGRKDAGGTEQHFHVVAVCIYLYEIDR